MSSQTRAAIGVSVVLENAADEVVTARLGRARAAGVRRVVTEGLVDMGDTGGPGHAAGTPAAAVLAPSRSPRPSLSLSKSGWSAFGADEMDESGGFVELIGAPGRGSGARGGR